PLKDCPAQCSLSYGQRSNASRWTPHLGFSPISQADNVNEGDTSDTRRTLQGDNIGQSQNLERRTGPFCQPSSRAKPHQSHIRATAKPVDSQAIGTPKPPPSHPKATTMQPQSHIKAGAKLVLSAFTGAGSTSAG